MARAVRYTATFRADLAARLAWLRERRAPEQRAYLRAALAALTRRLAAMPALGLEVERRGTRSYRVVPIGRRLPYLVWYFVDERAARSPVRLAMLLHEAQDRDRFDPDRWL